MSDHRGCIVALLTDRGIIEGYRYSAFGEKILFDAKGRPLLESLVHNPYAFASKREDEETGFIFFGRRYYNPKSGFFITNDPAGLKDGPNLYSYVHHIDDLYGWVREDPKQTGNRTLPS